MEQKIHIFGKSWKKSGGQVWQPSPVQGQVEEDKCGKKSEKVLPEKLKTNVTKVVSPDEYAQCGWHLAFSSKVFEFKSILNN